MNYSLAILTAFAVLPNAALAGDAGNAHPADPTAQVPPFKYESAFRGYTRDPDIEVADWRATGFDPSAPRMAPMGHGGMHPVPAQAPRAQPQGGSKPSMHGMHPMHGK